MSSEHVTIPISCSYFPDLSCLVFVGLCATLNLSIDDQKLICLTEVTTFVILLWHPIFGLSELYLVEKCCLLMLSWAQSHVYCQGMWINKFKSVSVSIVVFFLLNKHAMVYTTKSFKKKCVEKTINLLLVLDSIASY